MTLAFVELRKGVTLLWQWRAGAHHLRNNIHCFGGKSERQQVIYDLEVTGRP